MAIDRYLAAFESGTLEPEDLAGRLAQLKARSRQLAARRNELAAQLAETLTARTPATLRQVADHIAVIVTSGSHSQRKALVEALVAKVKITGPGRIVPVFRVPQSEKDAAAHTTTSARSPESSVRALANLVGPVGFEPTLAGT